MAGIFSPKNVAKLLIANGNIADSTLPDYITNADEANKEIAVIGADGQAASEGNPFQIHLKENTDLDGINSTEVIDPKNVKSVRVETYQPEVAKTVEVEVNATVADSTTYRVSIVKFDHIQSSENFRHIHGFYVTPSDASGITQGDVANGIAESLQSSMKREGLLGKEFTVEVSGGTITISNVPQKLVIGKKDGEAIRFRVEVASKLNANLTSSSRNTGLLTSTVTEGGNPGAGTGKQVLNLEYFLNGYETADYSRTVGFPNDFAVDYQASTSDIYNSVIIQYYKERETVNVERQPRTLFVAFAKPSDDLAGNTETNGFLAQLRTVLGTDAVPADLITSV